MTTADDLRPGSQIRAEATGTVYIVEEITKRKVSVEGLIPVPKKEIDRDLKNGRLTVVEL